MKWKHSAFKGDTVKLGFTDILKLLFGREVRDSACSVRLWGKFKA